MSANNKSEHSTRLRLVFVHGAGGSAVHWAKQTEFFKNAEAVTLPGHRVNEAAGNAPLASIDDYARWLHQYLVAEHNVDGVQGRTVLVGHSMGSAVAMSYCLQFPKALAGLVLVGAGSRLRVNPQWLAGLQTDYAATVADITGAAFAPHAHTDLRQSVLEGMEQLSPRVTIQDYTACNGFDVSRELGDLSKQPTLIITGELDKLTPPKYAISLAEGIANAQLEIVNAASHFVMLEKPDHFNTLLDEFLAQLVTA